MLIISLLRWQQFLHGMEIKSLKQIPVFESNTFENAWFQYLPISEKIENLPAVDKQN